MRKSKQTREQDDLYCSLPIHAFRDTSDPEKLREVCNELCNELASDLQNENLKGTQVTLKIKTDKFDLKTKVSNLMQATCDASVISQAAINILRKYINEEMSKNKQPLTLRLLGVRMSELTGAISDKPNDQKSIKNFISGGNSEKLESFECPLCGILVKARNEVAFKMTHFEKCCNGGNFEQKNSSNCGSRSGLEGRSGLGDVDESRDSESIEIGQVPSTSGSESLHAGKFESKKVFDPPRGSCNVENKKINVQICPICQCKIEEPSDSYDAINTHIDLCLNKQAIGQIVNEGQSSDIVTNTKKRKLIPPVIVTSKKPCNKKETSIKSYFTPMT